MSIETIDPRQPVGELVAERVARAGVFERFGIDYCCHGAQTLEDACQQQGLDLDAVRSAIEASDARPPRLDEQDFRSMSLSRLADHVESTHHAFLRQELPRLQALLDKVAGVHGDGHPELHELKDVFKGCREELDTHMMKEERILFPMIRQLESAVTLPSFHCGSVRNPIRVMEHEHDDTGSALSRMRELTGGYATPADGCVSYRALMDGLSAMERDLHGHIHKENNILFPAAAALEARLVGSSAGI